MKPKTLKLLERCIEYGVAFGLHRAYKHTDTPTKEQVELAVEDEILREVHEWFDFDQENAT